LQTRRAPRRHWPLARLASRSRDCLRPRDRCPGARSCRRWRDRQVPTPLCADDLGAGGTGCTSGHCTARWRMAGATITRRKFARFRGCSVALSVAQNDWRGLAARKLSPGTDAISHQLRFELKC
jgi:hypothetical protein